MNIYAKRGRLNEWWVQESLKLFLKSGVEEDEGFLFEKWCKHQQVFDHFIEVP